MTIKFLQILGSVFLLGGLISLFFALKYYREKHIKEVAKEIKVIDKETPDVNSNVDTYRRAEGLTINDDEEENVRAGFLGQMEKADLEEPIAKDFSPEQDEEAIETPSEETGALSEDTSCLDDGFSSFAKTASSEEDDEEEEKEEEDDETMALNTDSLRKFEEKIKEEEEDKTGVLLEEAEF